MEKTSCQICNDDLSSNLKMQSDLTISTQQEMTMTQLSLGQTSLSNSLQTNILNDQDKSDSNDQNISLSFMDVLMDKCHTSSIYQLIDSKNALPNGVSYDDIIKYKPKEDKGIQPYIKIKQIKDYSKKEQNGKMKPAIEIGISMDF